MCEKYHYYKGMNKLLKPSIAKYKKRYFVHDLVAALVVTAIAIPESLAFAVIVGLPPVTGLYTALLAPVVYALFASSRRLIVGADSATAALIASGAVLVAQAGTAGYTSAVGLIGLLVAVILMLMAVFRLGFLANLISQPVMIGFLAGVGVQLIITRLPAMLGIEANGSLLHHLLAIIQHLDTINWMALTISVLVLGVALITRRTRIPGELTGLILAIGFSLLFHVEQFGVALVGSLPKGFPEFALPHIELGMIVTLLPSALAIAIVVLAQSSSVIRSSAGLHDEKIRLNQDLFALGLANIASALTRGFVVNGSPPRSLAADVSGGKSQAVNIMMAAMIAVILLFGGDLFRAMPEAALATIVFLLGFRLIRFAELRDIWETHRAESIVAMIALLGTALFGVQQGVIIAVAVSLAERLSRQYRPGDAILLRDGVFSDWAKERLGTKYEGSPTTDGVLVYSFDGALFFENSTYFAERVHRAIDRAKQPVKYFIVDAGAIDSVDYTAVGVLQALYRQLAADSVRLCFAHVSPNLYREFDEYGIIDLVGDEAIFSTLSLAIESVPSLRHPVRQRLDELELAPDSYVVVGGAVLALLHLRDTTDIDLVVNDEVYQRYRDEQQWKEFAAENGRRVLSRDGFNLQHSWHGTSFKRLRRDAWKHDGIPCVSIDALIANKRQTGRRKDLTDITLISQYRQTHRDAGAKKSAKTPAADRQP